MLFMVTCLSDLNFKSKTKLPGKKKKKCRKNILFAKMEITAKKNLTVKLFTFIASHTS